MAKNLKERARHFASRVSEGLGENALSGVAFGTAYRRGYSEAHSSLNVLIITRDASPAALRPIEPAVAEWAKEAAEPPLIYTEHGWEASTDVFPIEIEEMREAHEILFGRDPFQGLATRREDLRQELEREVRGKLLRLRAYYAASAPDGRALTRLLIDSAGPFMIILRATLRLNGGAPPDDPSTLVKEAAGVVGFEPADFDWVVAQLAGDNVAKLNDYDPIAARYLEAVEKLTEYVDRA